MEILGFQSHYLQSDLVELCLKATKGELAGTEIAFDPRPAVGVVLAAGGYPGSYAKGALISGLGQGESATAKVFHAGTATAAEGVVTAGGRVLCATALGNSVTDAQQAAYALAKHINWDGMFYRSDIAYRAIAREQQ